MTTEAAFTDAQIRVKSLTNRPEVETLLELYSLYKQGTAGDVVGKRPGAFKFEARAKYDAWAKRKGTSSEDARSEYVALVDRLLESAKS